MAITKVKGKYIFQFKERFVPTMHEEKSSDKGHLNAIVHIPWSDALVR